MKQLLIGSASEFQPSQIVCLEHEDTRLYAEVIQVVTSRQMCWVRPLMLVVSPVVNQLLPIALPEYLALYDLRSGADLLWPANLFRHALDTEVISLMAELDNLEDAPSKNHLDTHKQLSGFMRRVWQAYQPDSQVSY
ncbi:hypothetical protein [Lyngbya aestuarii]|uniref:hypothetical protein n=1 Tax=Lyngbya aestuarii TaxID=118322 RepID=UPI00403D90D0